MEEEVDVAAEDSAADAAVLQKLIHDLSSVPPQKRGHLLRVVATFFNVSNGARTTPAVLEMVASSTDPARFSEHRNLSAKQFLMDKSPLTDIERVACLAFYLTHYRDTPHFKTLDVSKLNTEAAQLKFSNPAVAVENATKRGFLVPAVKGMKQLGVIGEQFVQALPDRDKAKAVLERVRSRRARNRRKDQAEEPGDQVAVVMTD